MTTEIQQGRYDALLRRVGDMKGPGSKVAESIAELFPTLDVENVPIELLLLMGTRVGFGGGALTGAAGEAPKGSIFNPAGSETIVTVTSLVIGGSNDMVIRMGINAVAHATILSTQLFRDTRIRSPNLPVAQMRSESAAALANATTQTRILAGTTLHLFDPNGLAVLDPGIGFEIGSNVNTSSINWGFWWRERTAEASELNL